MFNWFRKKTNTRNLSLLTDVHSHLLPGIDDGVKSLEEAEEIITLFIKLGYKKIITTPHVMQDHYKNTPDIILNKHQELQQHLSKKNIKITLHAAAEYYLDEHLVSLIENDQPVLTFGKNYLLFETNFLSEPLNLKEFIFLATTKGYKPIMAHPERYVYMLNNLGKVHDLIDRGVLLQLNMLSLAGYYSKPIQSFAQKLIDHGLVHLLGSDCHHLQHAQMIEKVQRSRYFEKALTLPLLNNEL